MAVNQNIAKGRMFLAAVITAILVLPWACRSRANTATAREVQPAGPPPTYDRAALPIIDIHTHLAPDATQVILGLFDQRNIRYAVNLSAGFEGHGLEDAIQQQRLSNGRIIPFCTLPWRYTAAADFAERSIEILERCRQLGVLGLKIPKVLGLAAQDVDGSRLRVDSPRLDPIFEALGRLGMVVLIHSGDPRAFFEPATPANERWEELGAHPGWSFAGPEFPSFDGIMTEFETRVLRHPHTTFIGAHFGNCAEDPARVSRLLERAPNYYIDTSARVPEFGRHPRATMRAFLQRWQDRVVFGTDLGLSSDPSTWVLGSGGDTATTQHDVDRFFVSTFRYFESNDASIENPTPIQGRWPVNPVGMSRDVLAKIYGGNAARLLHLRNWPPR